MNAHITKSFGGYVLKIRSDDLQKLRHVAKLLEGFEGLKVKDVVL